jgi:LPS-assembly protein
MRKDRALAIGGACLLYASLCSAQPVGEGMTLRAERQLDEANAKQQDGRPVFISGANVDGRTDRDTTAIGDAELRKAGSVLKSDRLTYYTAEDEVVALGNVRFNRQGNVFTGPELQLRIDANTGTFNNAEFSFPLFSGRGRAEKIDFLGATQAQFTRAVYTTCPPDQVDWFITADKLLIDEDTQAGSGERTSIIFKGRTLISLPSFAFPLGDGRRSGFLPPTYGASSSAGFDFITPYYIDIAPNRDLTLFPRLMTKRGLQLGSQFRYLEKERFGELKYEFIANDRLTGTSRSFTSLAHTENNLLGWRGAFTYRNVSDEQYFIDYARTILYSAERSLPRDAILTRTLADWNLLIRASTYQNILENRLAPPYELLPQLKATTLRRDVGGYDVSQTFDFTTYRRPLANQPEGSRFYSQTAVSYPIVRPGWFIKPKVSLHATQYFLERTQWDQQLGQGAPLIDVPNRLSRVLPTFSMDTGLIFERETRFFDRDVRQTLEPRLFYVKTPYKDQSLFPVFDTAVADFNFSQLFSENKFVGNDRISDSNQLTAAMVTRLINPSTGSEYLRFALGQRLYFGSQYVTIPGASPQSDNLICSGWRNL